MRSWFDETLPEEARRADEGITTKPSERGQRRQ